jgi:hypothetical protein
VRALRKLTQHFVGIVSITSSDVYLPRKRTSCEIRNYWYLLDTFNCDSPAVLAGDDAAASPVEIALGAFIACQIVVYRPYAHGCGCELPHIGSFC